MCRTSECSDHPPQSLVDTHWHSATVACCQQCVLWSWCHFTSQQLTGQPKESHLVTRDCRRVPGMSMTKQDYKYSTLIQKMWSNHARHRRQTGAGCSMKICISCSNCTGIRENKPSSELSHLTPNMPDYNTVSARATPAYCRADQIYLTLQVQPSSKKYSPEKGGGISPETCWLYLFTFIFNKQLKNSLGAPL